jgi:hypothetical protein
MHRFCPARIGSLVIAAILASLAVSCGALDGSPSPTATPSPAQSLGIEIAQAYSQLIEGTRQIVEPRPPAPEARERLRLLREEYKLQFGNYACLRDTMSEADQTEVSAAFDANRDAFPSGDEAWFEDAASDYDLEDPTIRERLEDIQTLDDYAFLERAAASHPGETLLCGG